MPTPSKNENNINLNKKNKKGQNIFLSF